MDEADLAQERTAELLADHLDKQLRAAALHVPGNENCADCGQPIPLERRRAMPSAYRCVDCQAWIERIGRIPNAA